MVLNSLESRPATPKTPPPPRPEVTLAVLRALPLGACLELCVARVLDDTDIVILNISKDPSGVWQHAVNVNTVEGTVWRSLGYQRGILTLARAAICELRVEAGDSLLVCQVHREFGRSAQSLVTVLQSNPNDEPRAVLAAEENGSKEPS